MSSVSGSDNSGRGNDEILRKKREEYQQKESELVKKHRAEVQRLNEQHYQEVENVKKSHENQMGSLRTQVQTEQARRDHRYQNQMNSLREMHRKQMEDLSRSSQDKVDRLTEAKTQEVSQLKVKQENQVHQIQEQNDKNSKAAEARFQKTIEAQREAQQKAIGEQRERIVGRSELEKKALNQAHSKSHSNLQRSFSEYREHAQSQLKDKEVQNFSDKRRRESNMIAQTRRERQEHNDAVELMKEGFNESLEQQRDRFMRAERKRAQAEAVNRNELKDTVSSRVDDQVRRLEQEKLDLEKRNTLDEVKNKKKTNLQIKNLTRDYQYKLENMQEQKNEAVRQANLSNRDDILKIHDDNEKHMKQQSRFYLDQRHVENSKNKQALDTIESDFQSRIAQTQQNADSRVDRVLASETEKSQRLQKKYEEARAMLQDNHHKEVLEMREKFLMERNDVVTNLKSQMQKREIEHAAKMNQIRDSHDKKLAELQDELMKTKKTNDVQMRRMIKDMKRSQQNQMDSQRMRYENQLAEAKVAHTQEISALNKRHEEQLDEVLSTIRRS